MITKLKQKSKKSGGFTLVELLIYIGIFSILLIVLTQIFVSTINAQLESEANSSVEQDSRYILARAMYDIQRASQIVLPANLGDQGNVLQLTINGVTYIYSLNDENLELSRTGTADRLNSYDTAITNLTIQRLGNLGGTNSVKIGFTVTSRIQMPSGPEIKNVQTVVSLRPN
jgi:type II secretory pathway pseudopilin PulG